MVDVYVLDTDFETVAVVDAFTSIIWTDRFQEPGDFELVVPASMENLEVYKEDYYLWRSDSEHVMIIEDISIDSDTETGSTMTITGRSLESILDRRIVWNRTSLSGNLQAGIRRLLNENAISPSNSNRKISCLSFKSSTNTDITDLTVNGQYIGDDLLTIIQDLCSSNKIGFKITMPTDGSFVFELYSGEDRTYDQLENPYVVFSPNYENLMNSNSYESKREYKTVALIVGGSTDDDQTFTTATADGGARTELNRRELYVEATDVSKTQDGETLSNSEYLSQLRQKGKDKLSEVAITKTFDGEAELSRSYTYGVDFNIGDIVQNEDEFGQTFTSRITEYIYSFDGSEETQYPTFSVIDEEDS